MNNTRIYLDHAATTPMSAEVMEVMTNTMREVWGNAGASYEVAREARRVLDESRQILAQSIGADFTEITLTSGGTESDNQALIGAMEEDERRNGRKGTLITSAIEHHAILHTCNYLEARGYHILTVPVNECGLVDPATLGQALNEHPDTALVSIMTANNEIGTIEPIDTLCKYAHDHGALFHTDAVQAYGHIPVNVQESGVDLLSASAHKLGGPKGIGFLYIRSGVQIGALIHGGSQERGRRAGTEDVPAAAAFACAAQLAMQNMPQDTTHLRELQHYFIESLKNINKDWVLNGPELGETRLPGNINISFPGQDNQTLLIKLDLEGISASGGSACTTGALDPSHVITSISHSDAVRARGALRFTLGPKNTREDIDRVIDVLGK